MKEISKSYFYSNKVLSLKNYHVSENELSISGISNLTTENGLIQPLNAFVDFYANFFDNESTYQAFKSNYSSILKIIVKFIVYEYCNSSTNKIEQRYIGVGSDLKVYEFKFNTASITKYNFNLTKIPKMQIFNCNLYIDDSSGTFIIFENEKQPYARSFDYKIKYYSMFRKVLYYLIESSPYNIYVDAKGTFPENASSMTSVVMVKLDSADGEVLGLYNFNHYLYVVQSYKITKIIHNTSICVSQPLCRTNARIIPNTIDIIDDSIVFLTTDGLYEFDGNGVKKIFDEMSKRIIGTNQKGICFNNKYYLLTQFSDKKVVKNRILEFNLKNNICNIYTIEDEFGDPDDIFVARSSVSYNLCIHHNSSNTIPKILTLSPENVSDNFKFIRFSPIAFNNYYLKELKHFKITAKGNFNIKIKSDLSTIEFSSKGNIDLKNLGIKGNIFQFEFFGTDYFEISSMYLNVQFLEEWYVWFKIFKKQNRRTWTRNL